MASGDHKDRRFERWLSWAILVVLALRVVYHVSYVLIVPFAQATFSDGTLYEAAARDIVASPPLGEKPFYLQGLYAYQLALGLLLRGEILDALLVQLALAAVALVAAYVSLRRVLGGRAAGLSMLALLSYFPLAFYENKYLSAAQGVFANVLVWLAFTSRGRARALYVGAASGLSLLARPNLVLALPFCAAALFMTSEKAVRAKAMALFFAGLVIACAPMALRNQVVTGTPTLFPAHGGGTSFYIGNNPASRGLWNRAGGLMSGQVGLERSELLRKLNISPRSESEDAKAIGSALYTRAFAFIEEDPMRFLMLEARKVFLLFGNDELSQDYDRLGERQLLSSLSGFGIPFGLLFSLSCLGAYALYRDGQRAFLTLLSGQALAVVAANVVYFTSSQHRLPLAVVAAALAGPGLWVLSEVFSERRRHVSRVALGISVLLAVQAFVPRGAATRPSVAFWYNLSVVEAKTNDLEGAVEALNEAIARKPNEPVFVVERAGLLRRMGRFDEARQDLRTLSGLRIEAPWIVTRARIEQTLLLRQSTASFESALGQTTAP